MVVCYIISSPWVTDTIKTMRNQLAGPGQAVYKCGVQVQTGAGETDDVWL